MRKHPPKTITDAIAGGVWRDPGPDALRQLLGRELELPELELFETVDAMCHVSEQLDASGYVDDPEFCMVRSSELKAHHCDRRLVFEHALIIAGSTVPGDDVFAVLDLCGDEHDPNVLVLDWRRRVPERWVLVGGLGEFIEGLSTSPEA